MKEILNNKLLESINNSEIKNPTISSVVIESLDNINRFRLFKRLNLFGLSSNDLEGATFVGGRGNPSDEKFPDKETEDALEKLWNKNIGIDKKRPKWQDFCICGQRLILWNCYWKLKDGRICGRDGYHDSTDCKKIGGIIPPIGSCCVSILWFNNVIKTYCYKCGNEISKIIRKQNSVKNLGLVFCKNCKKIRREELHKEKEQAKKKEKQLIEENKFKEALKDLNVIQRPMLLERIEDINRENPEKARHLLFLENKIRINNINHSVCEIESRIINFGKYKGYTIRELWNKDKKYCEWLYKNREIHNTRSDGTKWYSDDLDSYLALKYDNERWVEEE